MRLEDVTLHRSLKEAAFVTVGTTATFPGWPDATKSGRVTHQSKTDVLAPLVVGITPTAFRGSGNVSTFYAAKRLRCRNSLDRLGKEHQPGLSERECLLCSR